MLALLLLLLAGALHFVPPSYADSVLTWQAPLLRVGLLLGVIWLAHPQLKHFPYWLLLGVGVAVLVLLTALKPRVLVLVILIGGLLLKLRPRPEKPVNKPKPKPQRR